MKRLCCLLAVALSFSVNAFNLASVDLMNAPSIFVMQGRYAQAANSFHVQASKAMLMERKLGTKNMWRTAGLLEGLAAICAEKNNDPVAYEFWANSVRFFLMGGTNWDDVKAGLYRELELNTNRMQVNVVPGDAGLDVEEYQLQLVALIDIWDKKLSVLNYSSPSPGLMSSTSEIIREQSQVSQSGEGLRQYGPNTKLAIDTQFTEKQTFVVEPYQVVENNEKNTLPPEAQPSALRGVPYQSRQNTELESSLINEDGSESIVEVMPIKKNHAISEFDQASDEVQQQDAPTNKSSQQISRGSPEKQVIEPVQASQRRSFFPPTPEN